MIINAKDLKKRIDESRNAAANILNIWAKYIHPENDFTFEEKKRDLLNLFKHYTNLRSVYKDDAFQDLSTLRGFLEHNQDLLKAVPSVFNNLDAFPQEPVNLDFYLNELSQDEVLFKEVFSMMPIIGVFANLIQPSQNVVTIAPNVQISGGSSAEKSYRKYFGYKERKGFPNRVSGEVLFAVIAYQCMFIVCKNLNDLFEFWVEMFPEHQEQILGFGKQLKERQSGGLSPVIIGVLILLTLIFLKNGKNK